MINTTKKRVAGVSYWTISRGKYDGKYRAFARAQDGTFLYMGTGCHEFDTVDEAREWLKSCGLVEDDQ